MSETPDLGRDMTDQQRLEQIRRYAFENADISWLLAQLDAARKQLDQQITGNAQLITRIVASEKREEGYRKALRPLIAFAESFELEIRRIGLNESDLQEAKAALADGAQEVK